MLFSDGGLSENNSEKSQKEFNSIWTIKFLHFPPPNFYRKPHQFWQKILRRHSFIPWNFLKPKTWNSPTPPITTKLYFSLPNRIHFRRFLCTVLWWSYQLLFLAKIHLVSVSLVKMTARYMLCQKHKKILQLICAHCWTTYLANA